MTEARLRRLLMTAVRHTWHALNKEREISITAQDVEEALKRGFVLVEDYPDDPRGHSCLVLTWLENGRPLHIVCELHEDTLIIITVYIPSEEEWEPGFRTRRRGT